jgi:hypothetical protein
LPGERILPRSAFAVHTAFSSRFVAFRGGRPDIGDWRLVRQSGSKLTKRFYGMVKPSQTVSDADWSGRRFGAASVRHQHGEEYRCGRGAQRTAAPECQY